MTLFKKKKKENPLYDILNVSYEEAINNNKNYFYVPLLNKKEEILASSWAKNHNYLIELSHRNGNALIYKISWTKEQKQ